MQIWDVGICTRRSMQLMIVCAARAAADGWASLLLQPPLTGMYRAPDGRQHHMEVSLHRLRGCLLDRVHSVFPDAPPAASCAAAVVCQPVLSLGRHACNQVAAGQAARYVSMAMNLVWWLCRPAPAHSSHQHRLADICFVSIMIQSAPVSSLHSNRSSASCRIPSKQSA